MFIDVLNSQQSLKNEGKQKKNARQNWTRLLQSRDKENLSWKKKKGKEEKLSLVKQPTCLEIFLHMHRMVRLLHRLRQPLHLHRLQESMSLDICVKGPKALGKLLHHLPRLTVGAAAGGPKVLQRQMVNAGEADGLKIQLKLQGQMVIAGPAGGQMMIVRPQQATGGDLVVQVGLLAPGLPQGSIDQVKFNLCDVELLKTMGFAFDFSCLLSYGPSVF